MNRLYSSILDDDTKIEEQFDVNSIFASIARNFYEVFDDNIKLVSWHKVGSSAGWDLDKVEYQWMKKVYSAKYFMDSFNECKMKLKEKLCEMYPNFHVKADHYKVSEYNKTYRIYVYYSPNPEELPYCIYITGEINSFTEEYNPSREAKLFVGAPYFGMEELGHYLDVFKRLY